MPLVAFPTIHFHCLLQSCLSFIGFPAYHVSFIGVGGGCNPPFHGIGFAPAPIPPRRSRPRGSPPPRIGAARAGLFSGRQVMANCSRPERICCDGGSLKKGAKNGSRFGPKTGPRRGPKGVPKGVPKGGRNGSTFGSILGPFRGPKWVPLGEARCSET